MNLFQFPALSRKLCIMILILLGAGGCADRQPPQLSLKDGWAIQSSDQVHTGGGEISRVGFTSEDWHPTTVPTTVLAALVNDGVYPDPNYGTNLLLIPGVVYETSYIMPMPEDSPFRVPWWYRTEFDLPASYKGRKIWLKLHSVNYQANVWLNGQMIADSSEVEGAYRIFDLDITDAAVPDKRNSLALEIAPPVPTDPSIRWMQGTRTPPDKDMGIWYDMKIYSTGSLHMRHPYVVSDLDLPATDVAHLTISTEISNTSQKALTGTLTGRISPVDNLHEGGTSSGEGVSFEYAEEVSLAPGETRPVLHELDIPDPQLWWPAQVGPQHLYDLILELREDDGDLSEIDTVRFGIREVTSQLNTFEHDIQTRAFQVNGKDIFVKGANYTDGMLLEPSRERDEAEARYIIHMNMNAIRTEGFWGTDYFYDLCDKYGIMIFDGTNCCSIWERWDLWTDHTAEIAELSLRDQVLRKRNHPSFVDWLIGSDKSPPEHVERMYVDVLDAYDPSRPRQSNAYTDSTAVLGTTGLSHDPYPDTYAYLPPSTWYGKGYLGPYEFLEFNTEVGPGGEQLPPIESMRRMMPKEDLWPISASWDLRLWERQSPQSRRALYARYGQPRDLEEYTMRSQVFQKEAMRAMMEAFTKNKYQASGILIYRLNTGWPALCYQLYDYYLRPNGAFYGVQQASEPLHVQYSYDDNSIFVINSLYQSFEELKVTARFYDNDMRELYARTETMDIGSDGNKPAFTLPPVQNPTPVYFLKLELEDSQGNLVSSNLYWFSSKGDQEADFRALMDLPPVRLAVTGTYEEKGAEGIVRVHLENPTDDLAFFVNPSIIKGLHGEEVLPVFWSANTISLVPGESRDLTVTFDRLHLGGTKPHLMVEGWNVIPQELTLDAGNRDVTPALRYLDINVPRRVKAGEPFEISATIIHKATSGEGVIKDRKYVMIDGQPAGYRRVALAPGEVKRLVWSDNRITKPGRHTVTVGDLSPVSLRIEP